jgi:hypothetical protein
MDGAPPGSALAANGAKHTLAVEAWACGSASGGLGVVELLRNGQPFRKMTLDGQPGSVRTDFAVQETERAWYCVRVLGTDAPRQMALSGAFYFDAKPYQPPPRVHAQVRAQLLDAQSGQRLPGVLTEVTFEGTRGRQGARHVLRTGEGRLTVPGTVRLRAEAKGYAPLTLSPVLDCPAIIQTVTGLADTDLLDWATFERLRTELGEVELTFRLERAP